MQTPLSRRYDLKPPLPSASQAPSPAPLQNAALLTRISQMRLPEAAAVMEAIMTLDEGDSELPELCEAFQQRVAEIFNHVQLSTLSSAVDLISTLSDCGLAMLKPHAQLNGILEHRLNYFLSQSARILDARVENSVHSNRNAQGGMLAEFDHLLQCYHHADMLARNGLASLKSVKKAMEHLLRLVESAPLVDLQHRVSELQKTGEVVLEGALLDRLKQVSEHEEPQLRGHESRSRCRGGYASNDGPTAIYSRIRKDSLFRASMSRKTLEFGAPSNGSGDTGWSTDFNTSLQQSLGMCQY